MRLLASVLFAKAAVGASSGDTASITLSPSARSPFPVSPNFASLSMEISNGLTFLGKAASLNLPSLALMNVLRNASGGVRGPSIRIGGNSAEFSVWWEAAPPLPANQTYAITPEDIKAYAAAFPLFDGRAVIDTSMFLQNDATWAAAHAKGVAELWGWGRVEGVEVGNEVEIFHDSGVRPHSWSFSDYEAEFEAHAAALEAAGMPRGLIQGAVFCCNNSEYNAGLPGYTRKYAGRGLLTSISYHHYSIGGCGGKTVALWQLMSNNPFVLTAPYLQPFVTAALEAGIKFRVGEGNTVSCGGAPGVSDVFASALFSLDVMMETAAIGVDQWNCVSTGPPPPCAPPYSPNMLIAPPPLAHTPTLPPTRARRAGRALHGHFLCQAARAPRAARCAAPVLRAVGLYRGGGGQQLHFAGRGAHLKRPHQAVGHGRGWGLQRVPRARNPQGLQRHRKRNGDRGRAAWPRTAARPAAAAACAQHHLKV